MMKGTVIEILLVEDNPGDVQLTREALQEYKLYNHLHVAVDGEQALNFLFRKGVYKEAPVPDLILLDLNIPKVSGHDVLIRIKQEEQLRNIPVVILTTSEDKEDIQKAYENYASCYIAKPMDFSSFVEIVKELNDFWISIVALPRMKSI